MDVGMRMGDARGILLVFEAGEVPASVPYFSMETG